MVVAMDERQQRHHQQQSKPSSSSSLLSPSIRGGDGDHGEREKKEDDEDQQGGLHSQERAKEKAKAHLTFLGRHRLSAAISHLNNQINIIQEELNELETVGQSSIVCKE